MPPEQVAYYFYQMDVKEPAAHARRHLIIKAHLRMGK